jgi:hypothetical protein
MPSRRSSAFGSPSALLAHEFGPPGGLVCKVSISEPYILAQIAGCPDASKHADVEIIPSFVLRSGLPDHTIHLLSSEFLSREIVGNLLESSLKIVHGLKGHVRLWSSCKRVILNGSEDYDMIGELFFEAPLGYKLERVSER